MKQPLPTEIALDVLLAHGTRQIPGEEIWETILLRRLLELPLWDALEIDLALPYPWSMSYDEMVEAHPEEANSSLSDWNHRNIRMTLQSMQMVSGEQRFVAYVQGLKVRVVRVR